MRPIEGVDAVKPPPCRHCGGSGDDRAEVDGRCAWCCGLGVDGAEWWWEIVYQRNRVDQLVNVAPHAEGKGAFHGHCLVCLQDWPCEGSRR